MGGYVKKITFKFPTMIVIMPFTPLVRYLLFIGILLLVTTNVSSRSLKSVGDYKVKPDCDGPFPSGSEDGCLWKCHGQCIQDKETNHVQCMVSCIDNCQGDEKLNEGRKMKTQE